MENEMHPGDPTELVVDGIMKNNNNPSHADAEFQRFFTIAKGINNAAGFRVVARKNPNSRGPRKSAVDLAFIVLVTNFGEREWPDSIDLETGLLVYYGDNRKPGRATNSTSANGNRYLEEIFQLKHEGSRLHVPPVLVFENLKIRGRSHMKFLGLAAPGAEGLSTSDDLVAVWRISGSSRFTNYKARFTVLKSSRIAREWLVDLVNGTPSAASVHCPKAWSRWVDTGLYDPLIADRGRAPRVKSAQLPHDAFEAEILRSLFEDLSDREFEFAAAELVRLMDERFIELEVTPPTKDGGRDVVGSYKVGHDQHQVKLSVFVEAKQWKDRSIGVKPMARLLSRLRHRDLGVFVTTTYFDQQVQAELIEDEHPVLLVSGGDLARLLALKGIADDSLRSWLKAVRERAAGEVLMRTS